MKFLFPPTDTENGVLQSRLMHLAASFLFLLSVTITLTPAVRLHSWQADYRLLHWIGFIIWLIAFIWIYSIGSQKFPRMDPYLLPITSLLSGWGLITIWRLDTFLGLRQSLWLILGVGIFWLGFRYPVFLSYLRRYKYIWLFTGLLLTAATFLFGTFPGGTGPNLWLNFGGMFLQPSEPLKLLLIIYLSAYFADQTADRLKRLQLLAPTVLLIAGAMALLLAQRDLGTALVFLLLYFFLAFLATGEPLILLLTLIFVIGAGLLGYQIFEVIQQRVDTWLNPFVDPMGQSYQIVQSLTAIASGGIFGRGSGLGNPSLVPVAHSDFIFTAIAEEFGLIGSLGLIFLFILLTFRAFNISIYAPNHYRQYLAAGLGIYFSTQALIIIGGNLNLLPLSGITLPFVSYGGSSLLVSFSAILILILISDQAENETQVVSQTKPYVILSSVFLLFWSLVALSNGYWVLIRANNLVTRSDNLRLAINDFYVPRGNFVDRNNQPITQTIGERGSYDVHLIYPQLSNVIGYSSLIYGQAGLQSSQDPYLRGLQGNPASLIWTHALLYAQRPSGLDIRLSLDTHLQEAADQFLADTKGAVVLMNAQTGEILALATSPTYNANYLDENWELWEADPNSPFLNRATQGQYYPESALAPFLLYALLEKGELPDIPDQLSYELDGEVISCARAPLNASSWDAVVQAGCPGTIVQLAASLTPEELSELYQKLGFYRAPAIQLPVLEPDNLQTNAPAVEFYRNNIFVTPLQMTIAAAALSSGGSLPEPSVVLAVHTPHQGWVILSQGASAQVLKADEAEEVVGMLAVPSTFFWHMTAFGNGVNDKLASWFVGGTTPDWQGSPLSIVVVLENDNAALTEKIGFTLLEEAIHPEE